MGPHSSPDVSPGDLLQASAVALACVLSFACSAYAGYTAVRDHYMAQQPAPAVRSAGR